MSTYSLQYVHDNNIFADFTEWADAAVTDVLNM